MIKKFSLAILVVCSLFLPSCEPNKPTTSSVKAPKVLISIAPYSYFVHRIAGDTVEVLCLTPKGTNPHLYETPPQITEKAVQASIWFRLGDPNENKFLSLFHEKAPTMKVVSLSKGLSLLKEKGCCVDDPERSDLHIWLSPRLAMQQAALICQELTLLYPENKALYEHNCALFYNDLKNLDEEITTLFSIKKQEVILLSHPSLGYFCKDYDIKQLSIEIEGKEPCPHSLVTLLRDIKAQNITTIFIQPQHEIRAAKKLADELKISLTSIDPYDENYLESMRSIAHAIASEP